MVPFVLAIALCNELIGFYNSLLGVAAPSKTQLFVTSAVATIAAQVGVACVALLPCMPTLDTN